MLTTQEIIAYKQMALDTIELEGFGKKTQGKVRDIYNLPGNKRLLITTDRQSAFDHVLGLIPFKGQVLNQLSQFWFEQSAKIVPNHMLSVPDPNVMLVREAEMFPVEIIVRGYLTGVTDTSIWMMYNNGWRNMYGLQFPEGMQKNQVLPHAIITPTTHAAVGQHDRPLSRDEIINEGLVKLEHYEKIEQAALALFWLGQEICREGGLILVDTKYEFGIIDGQVVIADEVHTPDSSRFWLAATYEERIANGQEPENFDKELLRLWLREQGYTGNGAPPALNDDIISRLSQRYQACYEKITRQLFKVEFGMTPQERIKKNLQNLK
jgi:phosphoribosylaminoimidazole-succinocarboxamide synthase